MRDELYIDNQRIDLSADTGIYLEYKSYILDDISKLNASHSYTIKAPRTAHNCRLINGADIVSSTSDFPKETHNVRLLRDGIEVISKATLYLLSVTADDIEFTIVWNRYGELEKAKDANLNDLQGSGYGIYEGQRVISWNKAKSRTYPYFDIGMLDKPAFFQPVMYLNSILSLIQSNYGVTFDIPQSIKDKMADYCLPLLQRNAHEKKLNVVGYTNYTWSITGSRLELPLNFSGVETNDILENAEGDATYSASFKNLAPKTNYHVRAVGVIEFRADRDYPEVAIPNFLEFHVNRKKADKIYVAEGGQQVVVEGEGGIVGRAEIPFGGEGWHGIYGEPDAYYYYRYNVDIDIEVGEMEVNGSFRARYDILGEAFSTWGLGYGYASITHWIEVEREVLPYYADKGTQTKVHKYYFADNLPNMKVIDFIKSTAWAFGLFCYEADGVVRFRSFNDLSNNKRIGKDWSDYLVSMNGMEYRLPNVAKSNKFEYANDKDIISSGQVVTLASDILEDKATVVSSEFNAAKNTGYLSTANIKLCERKDEVKEDEDWDEWSFSADNKPYLLKTTNSYGDAYKAVFASNWGDVLNDYWQAYIAMLEDTRLLTCTMILNPIVLKTIDFATPIYLKQYGAYFAIQNIKTKQNDLAEVKLIKL